jgi:hypothetical protein
MRTLATCTIGTLLIFLSFLHAQYGVNQRIEVEDLYEGRVVIGDDAPSGAGTDWMRVSHGEGWIPHPSNAGEWYPSKFVYALCGNRHWLCDTRTIERCWELCADVYIAATVDIPAEADYIVYAYVANWADSAVIEGNEGCEHPDKHECSAWFVAWDDPGELDKVLGGDEYNVPKDYIWKTYPYDKFCGHFDLDTVSLGNDKTDCPGSNPNGCDFDATRFPLTAGEHTLYLKLAEEYTLIDWICVVKDGDPAPAAEPGRSWDQSTTVEMNVASKPVQFVLEQNYPNPFNPTTTISFYLPRTSKVQLNVYNVNGQKVANLVNSIQSIGHHSVRFDAGNLPSGTYWYKLRASCTTCKGREVTLYTDVKEMILVK